MRKRCWLPAPPARWMAALSKNGYRPPVRRQTLPAAGTERAAAERLAITTSIRGGTHHHRQFANQQVSFLDVHGVAAEHGYEFRNRWLGTAECRSARRAFTALDPLRNAGLGDQLAAGILRFYMKDKHGDPQFIGESRIDHTPMGSTLSLATGDAFDVKVHAVVDKRTRLSVFDWLTEMRYELTNALPRPVVVKLRQEGLWGDCEHQSGKPKSTRRSAEVAEWPVTVPANGNG